MGDCLAHELDDDALYRAPHSTDFVTAWRSLVMRVFSLPVEEGCVRVPGFLGGSTLSYLPLLNYTDLSVEEALDLGRRCEGRSYLIRVLDGEMRDFRPECQVTLRLILARRDRDAVWQHSLDGKCRNQVRKAQRSELVVRLGTETRLIEDFHALLARTLHRYGAPLLPRALFDALARDFESQFCVAYLGARPVAGLFAVGDRDLLWVPWAACERDALKLCPNHLTYWTTIEAALTAGKSIFDFGRSPYGGPTHHFKRQWGTREVGLRSVSSRPESVYAKYAMAQRVWRVLPAAVANRVGPRLCRYLADY